MRNRSHATLSASSGPGRMREPRTSSQRIGTTCDRVAAPAREVDELDVEHDRGDLLSREQVLRGLAREALEPALGVLDVADDPDRREKVEHARPARAGRPAASRACPSRLAGSGSRAPRLRFPGPQRASGAPRAASPCRRRRRRRGRRPRPASRLAPPRPCRRAGPAGWPALLVPVVRPSRLGPVAHEVGRAVGAAVVDDEDVDPGMHAFGRRRVEIGEQLVEGGADAPGLVVCRQHDRERSRPRGVGHRGRVYRR